MKRCVVEQVLSYSHSFGLIMVTQYSEKWLMILGAHQHQRGQAGQKFNHIIKITLFQRKKEKKIPHYTETHSPSNGLIKINMIISRLTVFPYLSNYKYSHIITKNGGQTN